EARPRAPAGRAWAKAASSAARRGDQRDVRRSMLGARFCRTVPSRITVVEVKCFVGSQPCGALGLLPPPLWGRAGEGGDAVRRHLRRNRTTPTPNPSPQGGFAHKVPLRESFLCKI